MRAEGIFGESVDRIGGEPISARMARKAPVRHLDLTLLLVTLMLSAFGAVMIYSATVHQQTTAGIDPYLKKQLIYMIVGFVVLLGEFLFRCCSDPFDPSGRPLSVTPLPQA